MFALGRRARFPDVPATVKLPTAVSASPTVKASGPLAVPGVVDWFAMAEMVGGVLPPPPLTVSVNVV